MSGVLEPLELAEAAVRPSGPFSLDLPPVCPGAVPPAVAAAFVAVWHGATTVRQVQEATGAGSPSTARDWLVAARGLGLVDWDDGQRGTLHATVKVVGPPRSPERAG